MSDFFDDPPLHDFPDRAIRLLQAHPAHLAGLVTALDPDAAALLDFSRAHELTRELPLPDWRRREADLLFEVPLLTSGEALVCVLAEHTSQPDERLPLRTLLHAVLYWERTWLRWEQTAPPRPPFALRPVLPVVLYTGDRPYHAARTLADLIPAAGPLAAHVPAWRPVLWDITTHSPEDLLASPSEWLAALAVVRAEDAPADDFRHLFARLTARLAGLAGSEPTRWHNLIWFATSWAQRRRPGAERDEIVRAAIQAIADVQTRQEYEQMSTQLGQRWEQEVFQRGEARGRRSSLRRVLEGRFGVLPQPLADRIEAETDLARLDDALSRAGLVARPEDVFA